MSIDEITTRLKDKFPDEIKDANSYFDMARSISLLPNSSSNVLNSTDAAVMKYLYAIAKDEYTHANAIKDILIDCGVYIPTEQLTMFDELQERIYRKFGQNIKLGIY